jgi:RNA polymerase sigma factor (sigma-70 family)
MTEPLGRPHRGAPPGTAPPIRQASDADVDRHRGLVHLVLQRMIRRGQIAPSLLEYDDLYQIGLVAVWEAMRRWQPAKGAQSTYVSSYIWGHVMHAIRRATKLDGWVASRHERIATVVSWDEEILEDITIRDTLAAPEDVSDDAQWTTLLADLHATAATMTPLRAAIAHNVLAGRPRTNIDIAAEYGVSRGRVDKLMRRIVEAWREHAGDTLDDPIAA